MEGVKMANATSSERQRAVDWLESLAESIWRCEKRIFKSNPISGSLEVKYPVVERPLTIDEFEGLRNIISLFVVFPHNAEMGFNFGVTLYKQPEGEDEALEQIVTIVGHHLPEGMDRMVEGAWEALSPFSHNVENIALLRKFGFPEVKERLGYTNY